MLTTLVERVAGARVAVFCDHEGESVELVQRDPQLSEYELKIAGAQLAAVWLSLQESSSQSGIGPVQELQVSCASGSLICRSLPDGDRKSTRLNSSHDQITYAVFCMKK